MKNRAMLPLIRERQLVLTHLLDKNDTLYEFPLEMKVKEDLLQAQLDNFYTDQELLGISEEINITEYLPGIPLYEDKGVNT